jgi:hypothetical protein
LKDADLPEVNGWDFFQLAELTLYLSSGSFMLNGRKREVVEPNWSSVIRKARDEGPDLVVSGCIADSAAKKVLDFSVTAAKCTAVGQIVKQLND